MVDKTIDKKIEELFNIVKKQKFEVENTEKEVQMGWKTNCSFKMYRSGPVNIQVANEDAVFNALTELVSFKNSAFEANEILGLKKDMIHDGYLVDEWIDDFKKRIATIQLKAKKDKLKTLSDRLASIVSVEQKRQMELDSIEQDLAG